VSYRLTVRRGPKLERERFAELPAAIDAVERRGRELEGEAGKLAVGGKLLRNGTGRDLGYPGGRRRPVRYDPADDR